MINCSFRRNPDDVNAPLESGYFFGFFQEGTSNTQGVVFAIVSSKDDALGQPFKFYRWQKGLFFNKKEERDE